MSPVLRMAFLALAASALAQDAPAGFVPIDSVERIHLYAPSKDAVTSKVRGDLVRGLREIYDTYVLKYGLEHEVLRVGVEGGLLRDRGEETVVVLLFTDRASYEAWVAREGSASGSHGRGGYVGVAAVPLESGAPTEDSWRALWHELSHVFFYHFLWTGSPVWLNEGLSEHFSLSNRYVKDPTPVRDRLARLRKRADAAGGVRVDDLLRAPGQEFAGEDYDAAWLLVHLIVTEAPEVLDELMGRLVRLEALGAEGAEALSSDLRSYAADFVREAAGGIGALQTAWEAHLSAMEQDLAHPKNSKTAWTTPKGMKIGWAIEGRMGASREVRNPDGTIVRVRPTTGSLRLLGPWPASARVTIAIGDGKGAWSGEILLIEAPIVKPGERLVFEDVLIPDFPKEKVARISVFWKPGNGAGYLSRETWTFK